MSYKRSILKDIKDIKRCIRSRKRQIRHAPLNIHKRIHCQVIETESKYLADIIRVKNEGVFK